MIAFVRGDSTAAHGRRRDVLTVGVDVGEHRTSAAQGHGAGGRDEAAGRDHHLVPGSDAEDMQREIQRDRAVRQSDPKTEHRRRARTPARTRGPPGRSSS